MKVSMNAGRNKTVNKISHDQETPSELIDTKNSYSFFSKLTK